MVKQYPCWVFLVVGNVAIKKITMSSKDMKEKTFFELLKKRRSIRSFKKNAVNSSILDKILKACDLAPSSGGLQTFEIYQVKNKQKRKQLSAAAKDQTFVAQAPLLLVFCANPSRSVERFGKRSELFSVQDATIATAYAQLATYVTGLSTVLVGNFDEKRVSEILNLPHGHGQLPYFQLDTRTKNHKKRAQEDSRTFCI